MKFLLYLSIFFSSVLYGQNHHKELLQKYKLGIPSWMKAQVEKDLSFFASTQISLKSVLDYYNNSSPGLMLVKFTIRNNKVSTQWKGSDSPRLSYRRSAFESALKSIAKVLKLPDVTFLISMHDGIISPLEIPVLCNSKRKCDQYSILAPDFEALREGFQVLPNKDLRTYEPAWETKKDYLIWRGSTAQASFDGELMREDNVNRFSRVILCQLSQRYPELINAKFTIFAQGGETVSYLQEFKGNHISFEDYINHKYQLFIDGNFSPYSASGWKFFTNSLIFKVDSPWIQWYFDSLKPYEHYIPVNEDLENLVEQIYWAKNHDYESRLIAKNSRDFALTHLTLSDNLLYFYYLISEYSKLNIIN